MRMMLFGSAVLLVLLVVAAPAAAQVCRDEGGRPIPCAVEPDPIPGAERGGGAGSCRAVNPQQCTGCETTPVGLDCVSRPYSGYCRCTMTTTFYADGNTETSCGQSGSCVYSP